MKMMGHPFHSGQSKKIKIKRGNGLANFKAFFYSSLYMYCVWCMFFFFKLPSIFSWSLVKFLPLECVDHGSNSPPLLLVSFCISSLPHFFFNILNAGLSLSFSIYSISLSVSFLNHHYFRRCPSLLSVLFLILIFITG